MIGLEQLCTAPTFGSKKESYKLLMERISRSNKNKEGVCGSLARSKSEFGNMLNMLNGYNNMRNCVLHNLKWWANIEAGMASNNSCNDCKKSFLALIGECSVF